MGTGIGGGALTAGYPPAGMTGVAMPEGRGAPCGIIAGVGVGAGADITITGAGAGTAAGLGVATTGAGFASAFFSSSMPLSSPGSERSGIRSFTPQSGQTPFFPAKNAFTFSL